MNRERVELWAAALRSGEYRQGRGVLTRVLDDGSEEHCCLGVACRVYEQQTGEVIHTAIPSDAVKYGRPGDESTTLLPLFVHGWFDVEEDLAETATIWNDGTRLSFADIADRLEAA